MQTIFSASKSIYKQLHDLCTQETNKPLVMSLYHALLTQKLNIQSHLISYAHHRHSDNKLIFPTPLPLLFSDKNTASDVAQTYSSILHTPLADEDLQFLFTLIENEKISTIHWLKQFLPADLYIPNKLHLDSLIPPQPTNNKTKNLRNT